MKNDINFLIDFKESRDYYIEVFKEIAFSKLERAIKLSDFTTEKDYAISMVLDSKIEEEEERRVNIFLGETFLGLVMLDKNEFENGLNCEGNEYLINFITTQIVSHIFNKHYYNIAEITELQRTCDKEVLKTCANELLNKINYGCELILTNKFFIFEIYQLEPFQLKTTFNLTDMGNLDDFEQVKVFALDLIHRHLHNLFKCDPTILSKLSYE